MAGVLTSPAFPWGLRRSARWPRLFAPPAAPSAWQRLVVGPLLVAHRSQAIGHASPGGQRIPSADARSYDEVMAAEGPTQLHILVEDHSEAVYRVALSVTRDAALAEDVAQDALLKAWQALATFRGDAPLRNWVLRITHNTAISVLRRRREDLRDPDELPQIQSAASSVERKAEDSMAVEAFEEALSSLDDLSRSVVVLRELEKLSYDEIAEVLDVPLPTVKTRLLRARRLLSSALDGWQP